jgi:hypothetical protein
MDLNDSCPACIRIDIYRIPNLNFDGEVLDNDVFGTELYAQGGLVVRLEPVFGKSEQQT